MTQKNDTKKSLILAIATVALLLPVIILTGPGCSHEGVGDDSLRLQSFLEVGYPGDSWSIRDEPAAKVTNVGPVAAEVQVFRFTLVADDDVDMSLPEGCDLMYEDMPDEMVLVVHCAGLWLEQGESLSMNFPLTGPWHYLELVSIYSQNEVGDEVFNNISSGPNQPLMWFNQNY